MVYVKTNEMKRCDQVVLRHYSCTADTVLSQHLQLMNCPCSHLHLPEHFEDFLGRLLV